MKPVRIVGFSSGCRVAVAVLTFLFLIANLAASQVVSAGPGVRAEIPGKISDWVLATTEAGRETDFLVVLSPQADLSGAAALPSREEKGRFVFSALRRTAEASQGPLLEVLKGLGVPYRSFFIVNAIAVTGRREVALVLAARPDVARVEGDPLVAQALPRPERTIFSTFGLTAVESGIVQSRAPDVWGLGYTGQGIVSGGQDTGYSWTHPALKPAYRGWNGSAASHDYNWHDSIHSSSGTCGQDAPAPCDDDIHGTHTMGTVVGLDGTNQIGMAPGAKWIGCRNMLTGGAGSPSTYLECFQFFLAPYPVGGFPAQGDPSKAPHVTNNSWACPPSEGCSVLTLQSAVAAHRLAGIFTVTSAGNAGSGCSTVIDPPAIYDEAFSVGALTTGTDDIASFSSRGPVTIDGSGRAKPDVVAPGTSIRSSVPGDGYSALSGTSMAGPHVAGAVALLWSAQSALVGQIDQTERILADSAAPLASTDCGATSRPNYVFGWGRLDAKAAVDLALVRPVISGLSESRGPTPGGTPMTITGANFVTGAGVSFGGIAATSVVVVDAKTITAVTPAHAEGAVDVVVTNPDAKSGTLNAGFAYLPPLQFHTVTPCRQLDTRSGSPIASFGTLTVALTGAPCGIPAGAKSVSVNVAETQPLGVGGGHLRIYPADGTLPFTSILNFNAGQTRSSNAVLKLSGDGTGRVNIYNASGGTVHVILDVNGSFQ